MSEHTAAPADRWADAWERLGGAPSSERSCNIAERVVDRHVRAGRGDVVALRWFSRSDSELREPLDITYAALEHRTNRFASALHRRGIGPGAVVSTFAGRVPELYVAVLGALKAGCVASPLFAAFGPDPLAQRLTIGETRVLVTTPVELRRKVRQVLDRLEHLELIVVIGDHGATPDELPEVDLPDLDRGPGEPGDRQIKVVSYGYFIGEGQDDWKAPFTRPETPALLHFTSGTTGEPKGALHGHGAVVAHHATARAVLDLHPDDVYWCTADPGWVTGVSYGIIGPLSHGVTSIVDEAEFDAERWYSLLARCDVDVWYTAPTALRMLERHGPPDVEFPRLRLVGSVGEPLDAASVRWAADAFGVPVLDTWWQTETGAIMIANRLDLDVQPGSMGVPVPGIEAALLRRTANGALATDVHGEPIVVEDPEEIGEIALAPGWPSMFLEYLHRPERTAACFVGVEPRWYHSGDLARRDAEGRFWFVGRGDDVIKTAGHLIGPFEVENVLDEHEAVSESGVIGVPDPVAGTVIGAFIVPVSGVTVDEHVRRDIIAHCRRHLGAAVAPRLLYVVDELPHTRSGKILRRVLAERAASGEIGPMSTSDTSTAPSPTPAAVSADVASSTPTVTTGGQR